MHTLDRAKARRSAAFQGQARKVGIAADQNPCSRRACGTGRGLQWVGGQVQCHLRRSSYMFRSRLSNLMLRQQRPDPGALCTDRVLQPFLADPGCVLASTPKLLDQSLTS